MKIFFPQTFRFLTKLILLQCLFFPSFAMDKPTESATTANLTKFDKSIKMVELDIANLKTLLGQNNRELEEQAVTDANSIQDNLAQLGENFPEKTCQIFSLATQIHDLVQRIDTHQEKRRKNPALSIIYPQGKADFLYDMATQYEQRITRLSEKTCSHLNVQKISKKLKLLESLQQEINNFIVHPQNNLPEDRKISLNKSLAQLNYTRADLLEKQLAAALQQKYIDEMLTFYRNEASELSEPSDTNYEDFLSELNKLKSEFCAWRKKYIKIFNPQHQETTKLIFETLEENSDKITATIITRASTPKKTTKITAQILLDFSDEDEICETDEHEIGHDDNDVLFADLM